MVGCCRISVDYIYWLIIFIGVCYKSKLSTMELYLIIITVFFIVMMLIWLFMLVKFLLWLKCHNRVSPVGAAHVSDVETGSSISLDEVDALGKTSVSPRVVETLAPMRNSFFTGVLVSTSLGRFGHIRSGDMPIVDV